MLQTAGYNGIVKIIPRPLSGTTQGAKALKFAACVNASTKRAQYQDLLLNRNLNLRLHALAEAGQLGRADLAEVLAEFLLRKSAFGLMQNDSKANEFAILALVGMAEKNPETKEEILKALEEAKQARHLRALRHLIDEAITKLKGKKPVSSDHWRHIEHEMEHSNGATHDHHH